MEIEKENLTERINQREDEMKELIREKNLLEGTLKEFKFFRKISFILASSIEMKRILNMIINEVKDRFGYDEVVIFLKEGGRESFLPFPENKVFEERVVKKVEESYNTGKVNIDSELAFIPLESETEVLGVVFVKKRGEVKEEEIRKLMLYTSHAVLALKNARKYELERNFRKLLEEEVRIATEKLRRAQEELIKSERLAAVGEMASIVAHEIRNPMSFIKICIERVAKYMKEHPRDYKYVDMLFEEIQKIDRISENMLIFAKPPKPKIEEFFSKEVMEKAKLLVNKTLRKNNIKLKIEIENVKVKGDLSQLLQVFLNLFQNSIYFLKEYNEEEDRIIEIIGNKGESFFEYIFTDNGPGIPDEIRGKIFEPFFTTKAQGTGLGLSISKRLLNEMKGDILLNQGSGKGATFKILLPLGGKDGC